MEQFDRAFVKLNNRVTKDEKKLVTAKKLTTDDVENYIQSNKPMSTDIYKFLAADGTLKKYINSFVLGKFAHFTFNVKCSTGFFHHELDLHITTCIIK